MRVNINEEVLNSISNYIAWRFDTVWRYSAGFGDAVCRQKMEELVKQFNR